MVWSVNKVKRACILKQIEILDPHGNPIAVRDLRHGENGQSSIDVHLGNKFGKWREHVELNPPAFDISANSSSDMDEYFEQYWRENVIFKRVPDNGVRLEPDDLIIWPIYEYIHLSKNVFARIETKSKWARIGLVTHNCAPAIQPGWPHDDPKHCKKILLEITNTSKTPIILYPKTSDEEGTVIAHLFFESVQHEIHCGHGIKSIARFLHEFFMFYVWKATWLTRLRATLYVTGFVVMIFYAGSVPSFFKWLLHLAINKASSGP